MGGSFEFPRSIGALNRSEEHAETLSMEKVGDTCSARRRSRATEVRSPLLSRHTSQTRPLADESVSALAGSNRAPAVTSSA